MGSPVVRMVRDHMDDIPEVAPPDGYALRMFTDGDEESWARIVRSAFREFDSGLFDREFGRHYRSLNDRCFFLSSPAGDDIATLTAWWIPAWRTGAWTGVNAPVRGDKHPTTTGPSETRDSMRRLREATSPGLLHWGAVDPEHRGRGLYAVLVSAALIRLKRSHESCRYNTTADRLAAIKTVARFGLRPDIAGEADGAAWVGIADALNMPDLLDRS